MKEEFDAEFHFASKKQNNLKYSPAVLQPSILRPPLIIRLLDLRSQMAIFYGKWPLF